MSIKSIPTADLVAEIRRRERGVAELERRRAAVMAEIRRLDAQEHRIDLAREGVVTDQPGDHDVEIQGTHLAIAAQGEQREHRAQRRQKTSPSKGTKRAGRWLAPHSVIVSHHGK
jgi:hypothetical protein